MLSSMAVLNSVTAVADLIWMRAPRVKSAREADRESTTAVRIVNLRDFRNLCQRATAAHGERPDVFELRSRAEVAFARFPVPVLGPGMARQIAAMSDGADAFTNVLGIFVDAEERLRNGDVVDTADAVVRAFAAFRRMSLEETRKALIDASRDCEFFSPELVLLLVALRY